MLHSSSEDIFNQLQGLHRQISSVFERCAGISASRLQLLHQLYRVEEISQTSLQKTLGIDSAAVTRHLKQLEISGMVTRRMSPEDNRFTLVQLTEEGRQKILAYTKEKEQFLGDMLQNFEEKEQEQLLDMLRRLNQNMSKM